jgi:hypothetical protein
MVDRIFPLIDAWLTDSRMYIILGLMIIQVVMAVAAAKKQNIFDWTKLGDFYQTSVIPMLLGYLVLYIVLGSIAGLDTFLGQGFQWVAFAPLATSLVMSIKDSVIIVYGNVLPKE